MVKADIEEVNADLLDIEKEEKRWEGKQDEKATCLSTDADEKETATQISSAHSQGGRCQARQSEREKSLLLQEESASPFAEEEAG